MRNKQKVFIQEYVKDFNATQAALRAGYSPKTARSIGHENLTKPDIAAAIKARIDEKAMSADEVLQRLAEHARGDMGDFIDIESMSFSLDLQKAKEVGLTRLIKKVRDRVVMTSNKDGEETETHVLEIELYDAKSALDTLAKYHGLLVDRTDITTGGEKLSVPDERYDRAISSLADALRKSLPRADVQPESPVDATEQPPVASPPEQGG